MTFAADGSEAPARAAKFGASIDRTASALMALDIAIVAIPGLNRREAGRCRLPDLVKTIALLPDPRTCSD
jgi:hypothetical protein